MYKCAAPPGVKSVKLVARSLLILLETIGDKEAPAAVIVYAVSIISCLVKQMPGIADAVVSGGIVDMLTQHLRRDHDQVKTLSLSLTHTHTHK